MHAQLAHLVHCFSLDVDAKLVTVFEQGFGQAEHFFKEIFVCILFFSCELSIFVQIIYFYIFFCFPINSTQSFCFLTGVL